MKILLCTDMYPNTASILRTEVSFAIHDFAKQWNKSPEIDIRVLVPTGHFGGYVRQDETITHSFVDGVSVTVIKVVKVPFTRWWYTQPAVRVLESVGFKPDLVLAHMVPGFLVGRSIAERFSSTLILSIHNSDVGDCRGSQALFSEADFLAFRSRWVMENFGDNYELQAGQKNFLCESGVDAAQILERSEFERRKYSGALKLIYVGRLVASKQVDVTLRALATLSPSLPWHFTVVGGGPENGPLRELSRSLGLCSRVHFTGQLCHAEALREMEAADCLVMVSRETFGLVYLEAMAKACVVIAAQNSGIAGVVRQGVEGYLCSLGEAEAIAKAIASIYQNGPYRYLRNCRETILRYTQSARADKYLDFLMSCKSSSTSPVQN